ncbi:MAG: hypothetical protein MJZ85_02510 [Bacteroidales bacterium]|nr:hypothetical protein [Bacteroidales bacterium]
MRSIEERGCEIKGLIIDGRQSLFGIFNDYKIQMCQFHMKQIIGRYLPYRFTCQMAACEGMPNTNNKIERAFTDLKKNLNNHGGMAEESRKARLVICIYTARR